MSTLEHTPFDILFRNFFKADEAFAPALNSKQPHPLNIFYDDQGLHFEVACTGLTKDDLKIFSNLNLVDSEIIYTKEEKLPWRHNRGYYIYSN